jgi:cytochrome c oxidase assembly protein subunit 15
MALAEFKRIFFWEYLHRLVGRLIGVVFFFPWVFFWAKGWISRQFAFRLLIGFFLGGLQGALGWFMVKSGLVDNPHVSHYRLAAHLMMAFGVLAYFFWIALGLAAPKEIEKVRVSPGFLWAARGVAGLTLVQIVYGAFTAGLRAGFGYNSFPKMNGEWIPSGFFGMEPAFLNVLENPVAVQFMHRSIGWLLLFSITLFWIFARGLKLDRRQRLGVNFLMGMIVLQFLLGVGTLLLVVPVSLASIHQLGACVLFLIALYLNHSLLPPRSLTKT